MRKRNLFYFTVLTSILFFAVILLQSIYWAKVGSGIVWTQKESTLLKPVEAKQQLKGAFNPNKDYYVKVDVQYTRIRSDFPFTVIVRDTLNKPYISGE